MPGEGLLPTSNEIVYVPESEIAGYRGEGFVELDKSTPTINVPVDIPADGTYSIALRYANGNGPVNTENRCAIRTILIDGRDAGIVVMPHRGRGNWNDWGWTNSIKTPLSKGKHILSISFLDKNENMNINSNHALVDEVKITEVK